MANEPEKIRTGFYIEKEVLERCDALLAAANVKSRNEFVTEALRFYCGYLTSQQSENYLLQCLSSVLTSTIRDTENRLARMDFKVATELSKLSHVVAHTHAVDEQALESLHFKCVDEVKRINGAVDFEDAYKYTKSGEPKNGGSLWCIWVWTVRANLFMYVLRQPFAGKGYDNNGQK